MKKIITLIFVMTLMTVQAQRSTGYSDETRKNTGICLTVGGVAFTTAALLEGGSSYGTNVVTKPSTSTSSQQVSYVTPPFWKQTPRNIMFVFGVTLTITGLFTLGHK
jgi:hypothetical protein